MTTEIKIFFTYCGADQHLKDIAYSAVLSLAEKYEAQGILLRFIAMDKDCVDRWDIWSKENAVGCDIMVPIITEHSFEAFDGKEKVILREIELGVKHNKRLVPVAFCSLRGKTAKQLCNTSTVFVTENEPEQAFVATMLNKIELLIVDEAERKSEREKLRELRMVSENDKFVGRERELEWLKDSLNSNNIVVLKGEGGTGKTTLAEAFFSRNSAEYIGAYIVAAKNGIKNSIASLPFSRSELSFEERYAENKRKLEFLSHRTIIIFDSCDVEMCEQDVLDELRNVKCKTIITSRDGLSDEGSIPVCMVGRMENEELLALVRSYYPNIDEDNGLNRAEADKRLIELFDYVDGHTLTIEMASAIMFEGDISILAIKEKLLESSEKIKTAKIMKRASAFDHLSALYDFAKLNDKERRVLNALCLISPATGIARTELRELLELDSNNEINELARKTFLRYNKKSKIVSMHALFAEVYYRKSEACRSEEYELVYEELSYFYWRSSNYDYFEMYEMLDFFLQNRSDALSDGEKKRLDASRDNVWVEWLAEEIEFDRDEMKSASKGLKDYLKRASLLENESKKNPTYCSRLAKCYGMIGIIYHSLKNKEKEQYYGRKMISLFDFATDDSAKKIALAELAGAMGEVAERHNDKEEYTESVELCKLGVSLVKKSIEIEIGVFDTTEFLCWDTGIRKLLDTLEDALLDPYWHAGLESEGTEEWIYCQELWCKFYKETVKYNVRNYDLLAVKSHELAEVYEKKNDKARAISYYINACEAYIRATSWAGPCITMKCQSMEFYNKSLKEEIQRRERMHEAAIECYERVTRLCYEANDKDKLTDLLRIEELLAWVKPLEVVKTLKKIAREIFEKNDDQGALKCFLRAYEICLNKCKEEKEELIILCRNISSIYGFLGDEEKSREYSEIAKRLRSGE